VLGLLRADEREPYGFRLAKKAVAFPNITTSSFSRAFSLRSSFSSSSSSGVRPVFSSASTWRIHFDSKPGPIPSSCAMPVRLLSSLRRTSLTASRLNSLLKTRLGRVIRFATLHLILAGHCLKEVSTEDGQAHAFGNGNDTVGVIDTVDDRPCTNAATAESR